MIDRDESYRFFLEEQSYGIGLWKKIEKATIEELAIFLTSTSEEERWIAQWQMKKIGAQKKNKC